MLKKVIIIALIFMALLGIISLFSSSFAVTGNEVLNSTQATELLEIKESTKGKLAEYVDKYGSTPYGIAAYILNIVRIYSIPFCFIGIAIGSIYQYVLGIRKLDVRDRGFMLIITFVTILLICQVLPLIFAIVVNGWRG
ncbi:MAG TPA: hypothetical protein IAD08_04385 [Candidatus Scatovivens faecipullorum]|nr:hypothetical protein [Candidatus Scatovivens faecipullorum]